jgi:quinol-cytochrome oxidoreductase complex cytochrome b subunit
MIARRREREGLPVRPGHVLYPLLALYALVGLMFGPIGHQITDDMPESKTHPYFPDHFWPYSILAMTVLISLGLLAVVGQPLLQLGQAANPRAEIIPRPEWYFLSLFQFAKLGPALITTIIVPAAVVLGLLLWPLIDVGLGPRLARRLSWPSWAAPKRNVITGTIWIAGLAIIGLLTLWSALWPQLCIPWPYNGPVCGG